MRILFLGKVLNVSTCLSDVLKKLAVRESVFVFVLIVEDPLAGPPGALIEQRGDAMDLKIEKFLIPN